MLSAWLRPAPAAVLAVAAFAGCGGEDDYENRARPPTPINVTAAITDSRVRISPETFGAGPVTLIVSNQTDAEQELTFETSEIGGDEPGVKQSSEPIDPLRHGEPPGRHPARAPTPSRSADTGIEPATIEVGARRASAQDELLLP